MNTSILVGAVTNRRGHRLHLAEAGRAHCGAGRGLILGPSEPLHPKHELDLCRRCIRAIRAAVEDASQAAVAAEGAAYSEDAVQELAALAAALETPAQRLAKAARHAAMVADIRARLHANGSLVDRLEASVQLAPAVQSRPEPARRRTWADLRDQFADADRRQLALTAAA